MISQTTDLTTYRSLLQNGSPGVLFHLRSSVKQAVTRDLSVGVDDQNVVAESDVTCSHVSLMLFYNKARYQLTISPSTTLIFLNNINECLCIRTSLIIYSPGSMTIQREHLLLNTDANPHAIVHVGCLLELASTDKEFFALCRLRVMLGPSRPADTILFVRLHTSAAFIFGEELKTVVVDEDVGGSSLHFVGGDGSVDTADGGDNDGVKTFFVDWHLNGEVRQTADSVSVDALGWLHDMISMCFRGAQL